MKLRTIGPQDVDVEEEKVDAGNMVTSEQRERYAEIVDKYIMGEPVEKKVMIRLRFPNIYTTNTIFRNVAKASNDGYVNMQVESSSSMLAAYVRSYNGHDFEKELGESFATVEGKSKVREYLDNVLIEPVRDIITDKVFEFIDEVKKAFSDESLDFS